MLRFEDQCCDCAVPGYPCLGSECSLRHVPVWSCDECGEDFQPEDLFDTDDGVLCVECAAKHLSKYDIEEAVRNTFNTVEESGYVSEMYDMQE